MDSNGRTRSLWFGTTEAPRYAPLPGDCATDVVVVGAGITGITAALLLQRAGKRVILLDGLNVLGGETGRTTAHLTQILDHRYQELAKTFGEEGARCAAESQAAAIQQIERLISELRIRCHFDRVPGFLYAETERQAQELEQEFEAARNAGLEATLTHQLALPFSIKLGMRVERQAQVHPVEYLRPLLAELAAGGTKIHTHTRVVDVDDGTPCRVVTEKGTIRAEAVFLATNVPINKVALITKVAPYRTYALATRDGRSLPPGLYWDMYDPYHYTRTQQTDDGEYLIIGGKDHRVAEEDEERAFDELEAYARERYGVSEVAYRWSGQIEEPADGLALLGRNAFTRNVYVATGFSGTGITWGTLGAMIASDLILGRPNDYAKLYDPTRRVGLRSAKEYVSENVDFPLHLLKDRVDGGDVSALIDVPVGEGRLVQLGKKKIAVYRDTSGALHAMSPVCTHMGCHVQWNGAERSWDCPCHGGRYDAVGQVLHGPPVRRLEPLTLEEEQPSERRVGGAAADEDLLRR